jgi:hypothetical protein
MEKPRACAREKTVSRCAVAVVLRACEAPPSDLLTTIMMNPIGASVTVTNVSVRRQRSEPFVTPT